MSIVSFYVFLSLIKLYGPERSFLTLIHFPKIIKIVELLPKQMLLILNLPRVKGNSCSCSCMATKYSLSSTNLRSNFFARFIVTKCITSLTRSRNKSNPYKKYNLLSTHRPVYPVLLAAFCLLFILGRFSISYMMGNSSSKILSSHGKRLCIRFST